MAMTDSPARSELSLRIASAAVLVTFSLALTLMGSRSFAVLIAFFAVVMGWEWGRVVRGTNADSMFWLQTAAIVLAVILTVRGYPAIASVAIMGVTFCVYWLHKALRQRSDPWWSAAGVYYAGFPAIALIAIRQDTSHGLAAIVYLFAIVWSTDTGAYFAGRYFGGPKLAPAISPNKTWSGLAGGACAAVVVGIAFAAWVGEGSYAVLSLQSLCLALIAQGGDLGESAIKRIFGVKNSSGLIPGHGGVLDRLDSLVFVAAGAGLIASAVDPVHPARALLVW